ncbi:hypothetical protein IW261DRAFT_1503875, partial [Armillaria novae-zelandiae]
MGGGGRYPYPKYVWSPAGEYLTIMRDVTVADQSRGGWWVQPSNWKANTAVVATGNFRHRLPRWII